MLVKMLAGRIFSLYLSVVIYTVLTTHSALASEELNILILHSYHPEYKWTNDIQRGIDEIFTKSKLKISTHIQYMDSKRYQDTHYFDRLHEIYRHKFLKKRFDLILTSDDNAFNFMLKHRNNLFPDVPLIFCGVNELSPERLQGLNNLSGINEKVNLIGGMKLALKMHPKTKEILIITDATTTGKRVKKGLQRAIESLPTEVNYRLLDDITIENLLSEASSLSENTLIYFTLFFKDSNERTFEAQEVLQMLMQKTEVPIYGVWDFNLGSGIVGGLLTSGLYQGRAAAEKAVSYLEKGKLDEADIIFNSPNRYMFDYAQLKRLDIPLPQLPDDSILINKPITFYELYQKEAWLVGLAFLFSTLLLILQRKHIIKHKENEVTLQQQRYKLRDQNKTLEDKVNERTWELNNAKEAAEQSMRNEQHSSAELARYVDIVDRHVISSQTDLKGVITEVSSAFCKISGYSKEELIGKNHNIVRNPNTEKTLYQEIWGTISQGKVWEGELNNKTKDGSYYWVETTIEPIKNETGYIYGYISISSNITDKKRVEELSITDTLTGLSNRLRLDELLLTEFKRMQRYSIELSIILCDIDFFKKVNDNYGHLVGDETLKTLAKIFINHCREVDFIGRWGGEEFLIICPETSAEQAVLVAEKLKSQIGNHNFPVVEKITCSFGVSSITPNDMIKDALLRADNALYTAKEKGRNRVEMLKGQL